MPKRVRDAGTGKIVSAEEAKKRPKETVVEKVKDDKALEARVALLERVIEEGGGNLAVLFRRRQRGLDS